MSPARPDLRAVLGGLPGLAARAYEGIDRRLSRGGIRVGRFDPAPGASAAEILAACRAADVATVRSLSRGGLRPMLRRMFRRLSVTAFRAALRGYRLRKRLPGRSRR